MTKLEWCRANCPEPLRNVSDEVLLSMMSSAYENLCEEKEPSENSEELNTTNSYLDKMVQILVNTFGDKLAFKGGYMLTKLLPNVARQTMDIDLSIQESELYQELIQTMKSIGDSFIAEGYISEYVIKEEVQRHMTGGIKMYDKEHNYVLGIDVGWHDITYGTTATTIDVGDVNAFTVERMLADKLRAILSNKRFRRSKDIYDLYCITNCFDFDSRLVIEYMNKSIKPEWENFPFTEVVIREYEKAYSKLRIYSIIKDRDLPKPSFDKVLDRFNTICFELMNPSDLHLWKHIDCTFYSED